MRSAALLFLIALVGGCATLPEVHPWSHASDSDKAPTVVGARGELSPKRAAAVLARLQAKGGSDLLVRHVAVEEEVAGRPLTIGNEATLLVDGPQSYGAMFEAVENARDSINVEFYIIEDDDVGRRFADTLLRKRAEGVAVNLMYDSVGCNTTPRAFFERLSAGGVNVLEYNPVNPLRARGAWRVNNRNHRKLVVVDGQVAFTGGINISDVYSSASSPGSGLRRGGSGIGSGGALSRGSRSTAGGIGWRDTNVRIEGPAVEQLQRLFLDTWKQQRGPALESRDWFPQPQRQGSHPVRIVASGPGDDVPAIYVALLNAIAAAEKSVHITMAYFVPDPQTIRALGDAAARGVDVKLVLPSYTDFWAVFHAGRSHYTELLDAGVQIYERQTALLHSKTIVIDGVWSSVGSSNLDWRSFLHNAELNAVVLGWDFGRQMETMFERDLKEAVRVEAAQWARRPLDVRAKEIAARIWEYWL